MPEDVINQFINGNFMGIPVPIIAIMILIFVVIYLVSSRKTKQKEFKPIEMKKQVKKDLNYLYGSFSEFLGKPIYHGIINIGFVRGYMPIVWNKEIPISYNVKNISKKVRTDTIDNEHDNKIFEGYEKEKYNPESNYKEQIKAVVDGNKNSLLDDAHDIELDNIKDKKGIKKIIKINMPMKCLKVCGNNTIKKLFSMIGIGNKYIIVDDSLLSFSDIGMVINQQSQPSLFYGITFFSTTARKFIEDIGFRINRENELQEIANQIPRTVFFDTELAKSIARMRETANIEKERFRGQKESAED